VGVNDHDHDCLAVFRKSTAIMASILLLTKSLVKRPNQLRRVVELWSNPYEDNNINNLKPRFYNFQN
ncbi:5097_t:CDS:2, partial [Cetraspora pellucida]